MRLHLRPAFAAAVLALALASTARAGQVLQLRNGDLVPGRVAALDERGVTFVPDAGGEMRVPWERVVPLCRFELWDSTLAADDAAGRVALARWGLGAGLFTHARREALEAKGLGYAGPEDLDSLVARIDAAEADAALEDVDELLDAGDLDKALERAKTYLRAAPPGPQADRVRARVPDLLARIERREAQEREQEEERRRAEKQGKLEAWVRRNLDAADAAMREGGDAAVEGYAHLAKGNQTRARDRLAAAEKRFQEARETYRRVRKAAGAGEPAEECERKARDCDRRTVEALIRWGRMETEQKAWKRASPVVDRGLKIDPVNRELLDLRSEIDENWMRRKLSGITNAFPRESN